MQGECVGHGRALTTVAASCAQQCISSSLPPWCDDGGGCPRPPTRAHRCAPASPGRPAAAPRCGAPPWPLWLRRTTLLELVAKRNAKRRNGIFVRNAGYSCVRGGCPTPAGDLMATHDARGRSTSLPQANPPHSRAPAPARAKAPMNCTPRPNGWTERLCAILPPTTLRTTCLPYRRLPLPAAPCRRSSTMPQGRIDPAPLASRTANRYVYSRARWG